MEALTQTTMEFGWGFKASFKSLSVSNGQLTFAVITLRKVSLAVNLIDG